MTGMKIYCVVFIIYITQISWSLKSKNSTFTLAVDINSSTSVFGCQIPLHNIIARDQVKVVASYPSVQAASFVPDQAETSSKYAHLPFLSYPQHHNI